MTIPPGFFHLNKTLTIIYVCGILELKERRMNIIEYVTEIIPVRLGVNPVVYGSIVKYIIEKEKTGDSVFSKENFASPRDRAAAGMPYQEGPNYIEERERLLNFLELIIIKHYQESHGEDWDERIIELQENTVFTEEEIKILEAKPESFWSG